MAAGVNDFIEATFDSSFQVTSSAEARLPPQQEWVAEYVALIRQVLRQGSGGRRGRQVAGRSGVEPGLWG